MTITRKIELRVEAANKEEMQERWKSLRDLNYQVFRAANFIINHQFYNHLHVQRERIARPDYMDNAKELRSVSRALKKLEATVSPDKDKIAALKEQKKQLEATRKSIALEMKPALDEYFGTSPQNTSYQVASREFPELPSGILACLNKSVYGVWTKEMGDVLAGRRSLRTYRLGHPMPFQFEKNTLRVAGDGECFLHWFLNIKFQLHFGRDASGNREIVRRALLGEYKMCNSSIQIDETKVFLLLVVDIPDAVHVLDAKLSVGVDLGLAVPAYCALSAGEARRAIGNADDFVGQRTRIQAMRRNRQKSLKDTAGGRGRKRKLRALENSLTREKNFASCYNHIVSREVVKFALEHSAAVIKLENLEGIAREEKSAYVLRNWSYHQLQQYIRYKAQREGIKVVLVDPAYTSQTCAVCGHCDKEQRVSQKEFICRNSACTSFGVSVNADYNGALNIARSTKVIGEVKPEAPEDAITDALEHEKVQDEPASSGSVDIGARAPACSPSRPREGPGSLLR